MFVKILVSVVFVFVSLTSAHGGNGALDFVRKLEGEYKGSGEAVIPISNKVERVSCSISNEFDSGSKTLQIQGRCATTQGKSKIRGTLKVNGSTVKGSFISPFANSEITQSTSTYSNGRLVVSTSLVDNSTGNLSRLRQIIKQKGNGFTASFQRFENASGKYENLGTVEFRSAGNS